MQPRLSPPKLVPGPGRVAIRTRLKLSERDEQIVRALGRILGHAESVATARRSAAGTCFTNDDWLALYHEIATLGLPAGYATVIAKRARSRWSAARKAQSRNRRRLQEAIAALEKRLAQPVGRPEDDALRLSDRRANAGYPDHQVWWRKHTRLQRLRDELARVDRDWQAGTVHIVLGGRALAKTRHNIAPSRFDTVDDWRRHWVAARTPIAVDGTTGTPFANRMIRLAEDGTLRIRLPDSLAHLATETKGTAHGPAPWYTFEATATFRHRRDDWLASLTGRRAIAYGIAFDPDAGKGQGRWYLTASFAADLPDRPETVAEAGAAGIVAIDLNADHLAVRLVDAAGNPTRHQARIPLELQGLPGSTRDARLREAIQAVAGFAARHGVRAVAIEDLGWGASDGATGRERLGPALKKTRHTFPTFQFKRRVAAMLARRGIAVVTVRAAYSTVNGRRYWADAVRDGDRHQAAAIVLGRRALRLRDRRRTRVGTDAHQRMGGGAPAGEPVNSRDAKAVRRRGRDPGHEPAGPSPPGAAAEGIGQGADDPPAVHRRSAP